MRKIVIRSLRFLIRYFLDARQKLRRLACVIGSSFNGGSIKFDKSLILNCPLRCDGKGEVTVKSNVTIGYSKAPRYGNGEILLQARQSKSRIEINSNTVMSNNVTMIANDLIQIGESVLIGDCVSIFDSDFHAINPCERGLSHGRDAPVSIGNKVWLGSRVLVLKGVSIGENSVIAAGSVVTNNIPRDVVAGGVPARVIRKLDF